MMEKVIREGQVAVLVSPGFGAGWFSWNKEKPECLFHPEIVAWVEGGKKGDIEELAKRLFGEDFYFSGGDQLEIEWVPEGALLKVTDYDGSESVEYKDDPGWVTA